MRKHLLVSSVLLMIAGTFHAKAVGPCISNIVLNLCNTACDVLPWTVNTPCAPLTTNSSCTFSVSLCNFVNSPNSGSIPCPPPDVQGQQSFYIYVNFTSGRCECPATSMLVGDLTYQAGTNYGVHIVLPMNCYDMYQYFWIKGCKIYGCFSADACSSRPDGQPATIEGSAVQFLFGNAQSFIYGPAGQFIEGPAEPVEVPPDGQDPKR